MPSRVDSILDRLSGRLLPPSCILCGAGGQKPCLDLCAECHGDLVPAGPVIRPAVPLRQIYAAFAYRHPVDALLQSFKYGGRLATGRVLGTLLGQGVRAAGLHRDVDLVVPVPLHPWRHAERGFNQAVEIARWAVRPLQRPRDAALVTRRLATLPQVGLSGAERRTNLAGAFTASPRVRGLHIAIVDDVTTTGSTVSAVARALIAAGAASVDAWCVAISGDDGIRAEAGGESSPVVDRIR